MEEQVQKRAGGDRNHGEPEPRAAGERAARARGRAFPGPEPEERGGARRGGGCGQGAEVPGGRAWGAWEPSNAGLLLASTVILNWSVLERRMVGRLGIVSSNPLRTC